MIRILKFNFKLIKLTLEMSNNYSRMCTARLPTVHTQMASIISTGVGERDRY